MASREDSHIFSRLRELRLWTQTRQTKRTYNKKKMTNKDFDFWTEFRSNTSTRITYDELKSIAQMHAEYYKHTFFIPWSCNKKKIQKYEEAVIAFLNIDGWSLVHTGDSMLPYDAIGYTPKGNKCVVELKFRTKYYDTKVIEKYK